MISKTKYMFGDITPESSKEFCMDLLEDPGIKDIDELELYISSSGGDLYGCLAMIDVLQYQRKEYEYKIKTYGLGEVASGGFFMFCLGDERYTYPYCRIFVHEHIVVDDLGTPYTKKMQEFKEEKVLNEMYVKLVADQLRITIGNARKLLRKDKWLTDKEINKFNVITGGINE